MTLFSELEEITGGSTIAFADDLPVTSLIVDSRKAIPSAGALFFAITGPRHDGHKFIQSLYNSGIRQFIVEHDADYLLLKGSNIIKVRSAVMALQQIAAHHRDQFGLPVIGITGSNAKTIVKEWLYQLLAADLNCVKNPGSYNSQTGVPLSVWQINQFHELGIFEAGISEPGEMICLQPIIKPTIGIITNIGTAHAEGFESLHQKINEKLYLFRDTEVVVFCSDHPQIADAMNELKSPQRQVISWGTDSGATLSTKKQPDGSFLLRWKGKQFSMEFPFSDGASTENALHCVAVMLHMGYEPEKIQERIKLLRTVAMRLELKQGINGCQIIDDTYNNDLAGLQISLDFLSGIQDKRSTVLLSDILQSGLPGEVLAERIVDLLTQARVGTLIGIGPVMMNYRSVFEKQITSLFYSTTEEFLEKADLSRFHREVILIKGARIFGFERIVHQLQRKIHGTVMEIDLGAMVHNLNFFRSGLNPDVKLMAMVKAFAYGSGSEEVASLLQYHGIDYLGVAYPDEGIELRKNNIRLPIMVMNPSEGSFSPMIVNSLEPELYSLAILQSFASFLNGRSWKVHIKIDTGMHRLGFEQNELAEVVAVLRDNPGIQVASIFSHLAGADESDHDDFTREQAERFVSMASYLKQELGIAPILHLLNSSGIMRFPEYQFSMVRLGIGLYGVNPTTEKKQLLPVATLKTIVSQIKTIKAGDSIGYGRKGFADHEMKIATLAIGYADGFSRGFSKGVGHVIINGKPAPVVGNVCMDMTMVDITGISASEGDEAVIFGKEMPIDILAKKINTIPYEILTGTSERVKRVFYAESI